jgi:hypothetical protein
MTGTVTTKNEKGKEMQAHRESGKRSYIKDLPHEWSQFVSD